MVQSYSQTYTQALCAFAHSDHLMITATPRPQLESLSIPGPAGRLEAVLETPPDADPQRLAVICHPHPVYGGTMTNKVVHMLAKACNDLGVAAIRFNYRGVGASEGAYDDGRGETLDTLAVIRWAQTRSPGARLWLGGFSFGGTIALKAAAQTQPERIVTVAPAIQRVDVSRVALPSCPWLLVQGDQDELVNAQQVQAWAATLTPAPELAVLPGVDHFFHGRLNELREVVVRWVRATKVD
jgi:uncharacterized protein